MLQCFLSCWSAIRVHTEEEVEQVDGSRLCPQEELLQVFLHIWKEGGQIGASLVEGLEVSVQGVLTGYSSSHENEVFRLSDL